jgi:ADP-heptose:LPS heptosyltransferase
VVIALIEHLGDIVACEPVARYARRLHPEAYILWCVCAPYRELIEGNPHIDGALVVRCLTEWSYLAGSGLFDEIIDLHLNGRSCRSCGLPLKRSSGDVGLNFDNYYFNGNLLSVCCRAAGIPSLDEAPRLYLPAEAAHEAEMCGLPDRYVVIHCGSNEPERDWTPSKWLDLIDRFAQWPVTMVQVGRELPVIDAESNYVNLCGQLSIMGMAEVIRKAEAFIGVDSGPAHIANAVGTFGIVLLGHYKNFQRYLPYSGAYADASNAVLLYADGPASEIPVDAVHQAFASRLQRLLSGVGAT